MDHDFFKNTYASSEVWKRISWQIGKDITRFSLAHWMLAETFEFNASRWNKVYSHRYTRLSRVFEKFIMFGFLIKKIEKWFIYGYLLFKKKTVSIKHTPTNSTMNLKFYFYFLGFVLFNLLKIEIQYCWSIGHWITY